MSDADFNEKPRLRSRQWLEQERRAVALDSNSKPVSHQSAAKFPRASGRWDPHQAKGQLSNKAKKREAARETLKAKRDSKKGETTKLSAAERKEQEQLRTNSASDALVAKCFDPTRKLLVDRSLRIVADTASKVTAEPEKELAPLFPFFLKLHAKLDRAQGDHLQSVKHCALISAVAVLRDILPGYKLRAEGVPDKSQTLLSRHVLRTQKFEQLLLQQYEKVVNVLLMSVKQNPVIYAVPLCSLATRGKAMSFNFRNRLVAALVKLANRKVLQEDDVLLDSKNEEWRLIVHPACEALRDVIEQDRGLEVCKEVVTAVGLLAKRAATTSRGSGGGSNTNSVGNKPEGAGINGAAAGKIKAGEGEQAAHDGKNPSNLPSCAHLLSPHLLSTLLSLKLDRSRELTEEQNDDAELDREMLESSFATKKKHDLQKVETEILGETIVIYLRVLRVHFLFSPAVLRAALSGLAKFATLVNVELLLEILQEVQGVLKLALSKMDAESASLSLSAVVKLLASPAGRNLALGDDLNWVATSVFEALPLFLLCEERIRPEILHCVNLCISECPQVFSKANLSSCALLCEGLVRDLAANVVDGAAEVLRPRRDQTQSGTCMKETANSAGGAEFLQEASKLLQKHQRLNSVLTSEGGLYGVLAETGITERPIQLFYTLTTLSKHSDVKVARLASFLLQQQGKLLQLPQWAVGTAAGENALKRGRTASGMKEEFCPSVLDGVELPKRQKTLGKKAFLPTEKLGN
eukprot:g17226.t1